MLIQISDADIFRPLYLACVRLCLSGHNLKEGRFSFAVCADQTDMLASQQAERNIFKDRPIPKAM